MTEVKDFSYFSLLGQKRGQVGWFLQIWPPRQSLLLLALLLPRHTMKSVTYISVLQTTSGDWVCGLTW